MKSHLNILLATAVALYAAAPGFALDQLTANAGLSLTEIAQAKFDRDGAN